jgi:hypothetical protein
MHQVGRRLIECIILAVAGVAVFVAPVVFISSPWYPSPLFPILRNAVEYMSKGALLWLFVAGGAAGLAFRSLPAIVVGPSMLALLPVAAVAEMMVDPTSHNLWPLEFAMYAVISLVPAAGAAAGRKAAALAGVARE